MRFATLREVCAVNKKCMDWEQPMKAEGMKIDSFPWRSLKARATLTTLAILVVAIGLLAFYLSTAMRIDLQHLLGNQQRATVDLATAEVNASFLERMDALQKVALSIDTGLVSDPASLQKLLEQHPLLQILFNAGIFVTRSDGVAIAEFPLIGRIGLNYMDRDHVATALTNGKASVGKPTLGKRVQAASFAITIPVFDSSGKVIGALSGATDLSKPNFLDSLNQSKHGESGGYLIVDPRSRQFVVATANNKKLVMQPIPAPGINAVLDRRLDGFDGAEVNINSRGIEVLTSSARIPVAGWFVIATLPTQEAFAPIRNMQERTATATVLLTLVAAALAWWTLKRQLSPMVATTQTLFDLSNSSVHPYPLRITTQDEIGDLLVAFNRLLKTFKERDDALLQSDQRFRKFFEKNTSVQLLIEPISGVIEDANQAAASYYGYPREQLVGMLISKINSLSPERVAGERELALNESKNHFYFQHRLATGDLRDVEVHSTPIESNGCVLLFSIVHDVTESRLAQEQLRQSLKEQRAILDSNISGIVKLKDRYFVWMNQSFASMLGYAVEELVGQPTRILYMDDKTHAEFAIEAFSALQSGVIYRKEMQYRRKDGTLGWFDISGDLLSLDSTESIWSFLDITDKKSATLRMECLIAEQRALLNNDLVGIVTTRDRVTVWANPAFEKMLGYASGKLAGIPTRAFFVNDEDHAALGRAAYAALAEGKVYRTQIRHSRQDGRIIWVDVSGERLNQTTGEALWGFIDITERKAAEERLALSESRLKGILEGAADAILIVSQTGQYQYVNKQASVLLGYSREELMSMSMSDITPPEDLEVVEIQFNDALLSGALRGEQRLRRKDGIVVPVEINASLLPDGNLYGACRDITVRKQLEEDILQLAFHDSLTGLANRRLLRDRLDQTLMNIKRSGRHAAVMFMDLDNFKPLNDLHGHEVGDMLLIEVAERLMSSVREVDTVARVGGDEFVVLLGELDLEFTTSEMQAIAIAEKVGMQLAQTYQLTVKHTGRVAVKVQHSCTASIGVAVFGADAASEDVLKWADAAMYEAKVAGRNVVKLHSRQSQMSESYQE